MRFPSAFPRPAYVLLAVLVVLGGGLGAATGLRPTAVALQPPASQSLPVSSAMLVCADPSSLGTGSTTDVTAGASSVPGASGQSTAGAAARGSVALGALDPQIAPTSTVNRRGATAVAQISREDADPIVVRALGGVAPGLGAMQVTEAPDGEARGLSAARCVAPGTDSWFVGLGTEIGQTSRLSLVNAEQAAASVEIELFGPGGRVGVGALGNVVIGPRARASYDLAALAPDLTTLAVHVIARTGRVAAAVLDQRVVGLESLGADWLPAAAPPARVVVVPGVSGGTGTRQLQVLAPGDLDTQVDVRLLTADGAITPVGLEQIDLTAGQVAQVAIDPVAAGETVAVELRSDQPIVAGLRVVTGDPNPARNGPKEMAYTAGTTALAAPTYVSGARGGGGWASRVLLTATDGPASVTVTYVSADAGVQLHSDQVLLAAGSTVVAPSFASAPAAFGILVTPHASGVMAVLQLGLLDGSAQYLSLIPLPSDPLVVNVPRVRQDLSTGLRPR